MKRNGLLLILFISLSMQTAAKSNNESKINVTFINEDAKSGVKLTIYNMENGKVIKSKKLSSKESLVGKLPLIGNSFNFKGKKSIDYAIEAKETDGNSLATGLYSLRLSTQNRSGTVKIVRKSFLIRREALAFVGNNEADQENGLVHKLMLTPAWAK